MGQIDRNCRREFRYSSPDRDRRSHGAAAVSGYGRHAGVGDRGLEIANGNAFSANQISYSARNPGPLPRTTGGSSAWCFANPEMKRRRRVAKYKSYAEGKVKESLRKGFRWIKVKCSELFRGL
ncbi:hypothetical protein Cni_G24777 [Canna indica]|uniref:DUF3511 domain protein n=1 Tax=Canna indica TaxID=4628 RepID=A0AAQ3KWS4_9LILI|nr:hypothetical protein Cni_G24777 [Canna indica]